MPNVVLKLQPEAGGPEKEATSSADGSFVFDNLTAGTYKVTVSVPAPLAAGPYTNLAVTAGRGTNVNIALKLDVAKAPTMSSSIAPLRSNMWRSMGTFEIQLCDLFPNSPVIVSDGLSVHLKFPLGSPTPEDAAPAEAK